MLERREFLAAAMAWQALSAWAADEGGELIPFLDAPKFDPEKPRLPWDQTTDWVTPKNHFFRVAHYGYPDVDAQAWRLDVTGMVERPRSYTLDDLKKRAKKEFFAT